MSSRLTVEVDHTSAGSRYLHSVRVYSEKHIRVRDDTEVDVRLAIKRSLIARRLVEESM